MGWQDRDYNAGREHMRAYMANPGAFLQFALPLYTSSKLHIRLSFWFLISAIFSLVANLRLGNYSYIPLDLGILLGVCLFHELGHRVFARMVGGNHWEWVLWPFGGMVAPTNPPTAKATFVANIGGIVFSLGLIVVVLATALLAGGMVVAQASLMMPVAASIPSAPPWLAHAAGAILSQNVWIILINLFPCYWFDGGHLWQSVLWPFVGRWKAVRITCVIGMVLSGLLFALALFNTDFFSMILWALIFADCFRRRMAIAHVEEGMYEEETTYDYMDTQTPAKRKKLKKRWLSSARKRAQQDQAEQAKIDAILAKVKEKGLHSLTWWEKRALKKATERQRQNELADRP